MFSCSKGLNRGIAIIQGKRPGPAHINAERAMINRCIRLNLEDFSAINIGDIEDRLQPSIRFQASDRDTQVAGAQDRSVDYSLNYVIHGQSARVSLVFQDISYTGGDDDQNLILGGQIRF